MSGARSRRKGAAGERELAAIISQLSGETIARNLAQVREGGGDLEFRGCLIECKRCESFSLGRWWRQAVTSALRKGLRPIVAWRRSHGPWHCWIACSPPELIVALEAIDAHRMEKLDQAEPEDG